VAETTALAPYVELSELSKAYKGAATPAVDRVSLSIEQGEFLALLGPSGCGKTTTLRMLAGLTEPTSGAVRVGGKDLTRVSVHRRGMGMVFQSYALFPHLDVRSNVAYGLRVRGVSRAELQRRVEAALAMVRLEHLADRRVQALSGGQQQRIALARALVVEPTVLLMDEPLSALDAKLRDAMRVEIRGIQQRLGITSVFVTHDQAEALTMADKIAVMSHGRLEQFGTPADIFERPQTRFVAEFVGDANLIESVDVEATSAGWIARGPALGALAVPRGDGAVPTGSTLMIRPHQLRVQQGRVDGGAPGVVRSATYFGDTVRYEVQVGDALLKIDSLAGSDRLLDVGATATVVVRADAVHFIPPADPA